MKARILIVDDDLGISDSMQQFIEMAGYEAFTANNAEEALEFLKKKPVHILITDIMLPGLNGLELTDLVKRDYDADVLVMTGYSEEYSYEEAINKGASDFVFKPVRYEELLLRIKRVLNERQLTKERIHMLRRLQKLAITDALTKLYNSRHFYTQIELEVDRSNRYGHPLALLLMDIDHFKVYNDAYGHLEGNKVLHFLGRAIKSCLRKMDSAYRYGGEEFTVILPDTSGKEAEIVAHRIRTTIANQVFTPEPDKKEKITVSIGVTEYCRNEEITAFIHRSDKAMYQSKNNGRNRVSCLYYSDSSV
ncbi:MAG: diguanylate cyclase [Desulfobacterales bacterium]|jgi:diguanylate cyclase (GGDEF)-like protein|nr:diguanylate cyclase [Desulfobacterales bacterium]